MCARAPPPHPHPFLNRIKLKQPKGAKEPAKLQALRTSLKVLIIGGGDGGVLREVVKHDTVEKAMS